MTVAVAVAVVVVVVAVVTDIAVAAVVIREFKKPRRRRPGQRRLKNEFIFYLRISRYSKVIYFAYHCQNYRKTKSGTQR